jgi:hypothetical protein
VSLLSVIHRLFIHNEVEWILRKDSDSDTDGTVLATT